MSLLAETMEALRFTEEQNRMILESGYSSEKLARLFKRPVRAIQRQRAYLKRLQEEEKGAQGDR
jgi:hypothetical protein